jgi:predicted Zn-dependent peptidase
MEFKKKVLENGLTILFEKRDVPVTTVMLAAKYGAAYETSEEKGMAHFMEHLCFKGTEKRDVRQISSEVERVGGDLNAFTHEEVTAYHVKLPSEHLKIAMDVIFDIFFNATFPEEEVKKEGGVICEEIKMYEDNPHMHTIENIKKNLYEAPFGDFIGGSQENVRGMNREVLFEKHRKMYIPKNSILCVVGNNDFDEIINLVKSMKMSEGEVEKRVPEIVKKTKISREKREGISQTNLALGFHFPLANEKQRYAAEIFSAILGEGMSSRLFSEVREKRGLVYGVKTDLDLGENYGYMIIWAGTDGEKEKEVIDICLKEFSKMEQVTEEELTQAKIQVIGNRHVENEGSNDTAVNLVLEEISGDANDYYKYEEKINSVTLDEIKELSKRIEYSSFSLGPQ